MNCTYFAILIIIGLNETNSLIVMLNNFNAFILITKNMMPIGVIQQ